MNTPSNPIQKVSAQAYLFADFTLDLSRGGLLHRDHEVKLRHKSFEVLKYLVINRGRLIGKEELIGAVWPDAFVTDDSLSHCLMEVRHALGEISQDILKTVPRRGYLFDAEVSELYDRVPNGKVRPQPQETNDGPDEVEEVARVQVVVESGKGTTTGFQRNTAGAIGRQGAVGAIAATNRSRNGSDRAPIVTRARLWTLTAVVLLVVLSIIALRRRSGPLIEKTPGMLAAQLTANPLDNGVYRAAISPDGEYLAYADLNGLHILAIDTGEVRNIRVPERFSPR